MTLTQAFAIHTNFASLIPMYDAFLLDQYGVMHNGSTALPGAVSCIQSLSKSKKMMILSNTSSIAEAALKKLEKYGFDEKMFGGGMPGAGGLVSSGEECARYVRENYSCAVGRNKKALWLTWQESDHQKPLEFLSHCGCDHEEEEQQGIKRIDVAASVQDADFILLQGSQVWRRKRHVDDAAMTVSEEPAIQDLNFMYEEDYSVIDPILQQSVKEGLTMVCANPDLVVAMPGGVIANMPGKIANRYESMGGTVQTFGKPNPRHFHACLSRLGINIPPHNDFNSQLPDNVSSSTSLSPPSVQAVPRIPGVAHVGDSLHHDVAGANAAGIDSIFVLGGIHAPQLGFVPGGTIVVKDNLSDDNGENNDLATTKSSNVVCKEELRKRLEILFENEGIWPTHVVPSLSLGTCDNGE